MASPIYPLEGVALDSTGDEVAGSLGHVVKAIQTTQTSDSSDITAIKAVTDVLPDAGALTSIAQESTLEDVEAEVGEIDQHNHNVERWWGAVAVPDETNAIEVNVNRPFVAISGANTWGAAIPIKGSADNPVLSGMTSFDAHRIMVTDLDDDTTPWRLRIIFGTGTSGDAITAGQWSEIMVMTNAVPGNRAGASPVDIRMPPCSMATKLWAQSFNDTNLEELSFFFGCHGYPYPPP